MGWVVMQGGCGRNSNRTRLATPRVSSALNVHGLLVGVFVLETG